MVVSAKLTVPSTPLPAGGIVATMVRFGTALPAASTAAKFTDPLKFIVNLTFFVAVLATSY